MGQVLRTLVGIRNPKMVSLARALINEALATAMHATHCASLVAIQGLFPGTVAVNHDMFLNLPIYADILTIKKHHQELVDK